MCGLFWPALSLTGRLLFTATLPFSNSGGKQRIGGNQENVAPAGWDQYDASGLTSSKRIFFPWDKLLHYHLIGLNCRYSHSCLALFYVRNELRSNLPQARITLTQLTINDPYYDTLLKISGCGADVLFFSVYIWNAVYISRLLTDLATVRPELPVVLGGPQASAMEKLPGNCTVVDGEVEGIGQQFYRDLEAGELRPIYPARAGSPFQSPYLAEDFSGELRNRQVYYESSRGCPFQCSYCLSSVSKGVVHKNVDSVCRELDTILQHQPKIIKFVDRTFNDNPERALTIWQYLAQQPGPTRFHFEIAPDRFTEEMFSFLETVAAGRFQFEIGIQSTSEQTLAAINRKMDVDLAAANIKRLGDLDTIHLHVDLILGLPFETEESFRDSFNRVFSLCPHYIQMGLLKVLPGTAISRKTQEFGLLSCEQPPYQVLANRWLAHPEISRLYAFGECFEAFYNTRYFRSIWQYLQRGAEEPFLFFQNLLAVSKRKHYSDLSPTQELLTRILCELADEREDGETLKELLRYDWLRCGHRFLPDVLVTVPLADLRSTLWQKLPQNLEGLYTHQNRSSFFKKTNFLEMSGNVLQQVGLGPGSRGGVVCFLPEQTGGVIKHCRTELVEAS